ncbi:glycosyltransferase family 87 protein [Microlunatus sp. Gsoil 973]|uniref:glycosyltransferase family 87 protein n=1 Tax=Microlunatus sp. Gsoil 973 TaxID=2672569 RepID=UPI0018A8567C|nr:glycosyltransferase family 87 protein [Microlunatus sp. Gsoil 973]
MSSVATKAPSPTTGRPIGLRLRIVAAVVVVMLVDGSIIGLREFQHGRLGLLVAVLVFGLLGIWCRGVLPALRLRTVAVICAVVQLPGLLSRPLLSDDSYRYVWDGRVQLAGVDPYRYSPISPMLAPLRDPLLFPPGHGSGVVNTVINRPWAHTIYPPIAELWFTVLAAVTPWWAGTLGLQIASALAVVATTVLIGRVLIRTGSHPGWALAYGACPATTIEAANGAHVDVLAALLLVIMAWSVITNRHWLAGVMLGLAGGVKLVPMLLVPIFLRRQPVRTAATSVATLLTGYLPHILAVGSLVLGYLPGYLNEEGFDGRRRFALLIFLPEPARLPVALAIAVALAVVAILRSRRDLVLVTCCWLYGAAFLVATPTYPWYLLPAMVLVVMARRFEWLMLWPAAYFGFLHDREPVLQTIGYGIALIVMLGTGWRRRVRTTPDAGGSADR